MGARKPRAGGGRRVVAGPVFRGRSATTEAGRRCRASIAGGGTRSAQGLARAGPGSAHTGCSRARRDDAAEACTRRGLGYGVGNGSSIHRHLLGWLALRDDPSGSRSIRHGEPAGYSSELSDAPAAVPGRARMSAGHWLPPIPIEPWRTAHPTDQTRALVYALGTPKSLKPAPTDELFPTTGKPTGAARAASRELSEEGASAAASTLPAISPIAAAQGAPQLDPSALIARGDEFLRQSDVVSARLFYQLAAANGSAAGAIAMGSTYDPVFLTRNAVRGVKPEPEKALVWYRTAAQLGDPDGKTRTAQLLDDLRLDAAHGDVRARAILDNAAIE